MGLNSEKKESRDDRKKKGNSGLHKIVFAFCLYDAKNVGGISGIFFVPDYWYICMMKIVLLILLCLGISAPMQGSAATPHSKKRSRFVETELSFAAKQSMSMYESVKDQKGRLPNRTDRNDEFKTCPSNDWVSGFYPGLLWYIHEDTGDASAAAIDASALIELSRYIAGAKSKKYLRLAEQILFSLSSQKYRAQNVGDNHNFILKHSTIFWSEGNFDTAVTYADYYYVEALMRYKRLLQGRPVVDVCTAK